LPLHCEKEFLTLLALSETVSSKLQKINGKHEKTRAVIALVKAAQAAAGITA
jgi:hypothetical protein